MSDIAIRVENLSKLYHIGAAQKRHDTLRDAIVDFGMRIADSGMRIVDRGVRNRTSAVALPNPQSPIPNPKSILANSQSDSTIWALRDVSFDVKRGEVVGIIGRNGAGKSTLLRILSRITEPTEGRAEIHGRVGSLLEVGTGFHPELTGRENIYLNGAILGMKRAEIERKFDEIVAFAEIEKFLDTPVKHYSSGMYVRLAFAVAAHLEPEILLVDEVLAVGDAQFQKKCLGKMGDVAKEGRTVLFVSHNMRAVEQLCNEAILFEEGRIIHRGRSQAVIEDYLQRYTRTDMKAERDVRNVQREYPGDARILRVALMTTDDTLTSSIGWGKPFKVKFLVVGNGCKGALNFAVSVKDLMGGFVFVSHSTDHGLPTELPLGSRVEVTCHVSPNLLMPGQYLIDVWVGDESWRTFDFVRDVLTFEVTSVGADLSLHDRRPGNIYLPLRWTLDQRSREG